MPQRSAAGATTVEQLLSSTTFLGSLTDAERASFFGTEPRQSSPARYAGARSPRAEAAALAGAAAANHWEACLDAVEEQQCSPCHSCSPSKQQLLLYQHMTDLDGSQQLQRPATAGAGVSTSTTSGGGWDALRQQSHVLLLDNEQLQKDNRLLQKQREQLQAKITSLQHQVTMLLASQRSAAEGSSKLAALEGVIGQLQATLAHISAMAGKAAQENKALLCENHQLAAERARLQEALQHMKARIRELEADLLVKVAASSQDAADAAAVAAAADPLLLLPGMTGLAGAAASSISSLTAGSAGAGKIGPALQEIAVLKRSRDTLQRDVAMLQQQLSAAERGSQAAAAAAAAERARAARIGGQGLNRLAAAMQRLEAVAAREQQQAAALLEREEYIARLEQCLLDQHKQLSQLAAAASKGRRAGAAAAVASLSVQLQEVAKIPPSPDAHLRPGFAGAAAAGEAPDSSSRPSSPVAGSNRGPSGGAAVAGAATGGLSPARSFAELQVEQVLLQQQWQQQVQLGVTPAIRTPGVAQSLAQQHAAADERDGSRGGRAGIASERAAAAKHCRDMQLRVSGGWPSSGSKLSPTAAAASPSKRSAMPVRQQQRQLMLMQHLDVFQDDAQQQQQQQQQQLRGLQQLQSSKLQHQQQQQQRHHSAGSLRRAANCGGHSRGATDAAAMASSNGSAVKGAGGTSSTTGRRHVNNSSTSLVNKAQGKSEGMGGPPVAAAAAAAAAKGVKTSQLHQLHMQRQRRLKELLQQKQQRQQQRLQPGVGQQKQQRLSEGAVQKQHQQPRGQPQQLEYDSRSEDEFEPCPSEQPVPAAGMQVRPAPQHAPEDEQQQQWKQQHAERIAQGDWQHMQQLLQQNDRGSSQHNVGAAARRSLKSPRTAAAPAQGQEQSSSHLQHVQQQQRAMQESSLASGLGLAAVDVAAACVGSPRRHLSMQPKQAAAAASSTSIPSCYSPTSARELLNSAAASPERLQANWGQLSGLLPCQLSGDILNQGDAVGNTDAAAAAYEARLVAKVLEMERSMQALESQLMHVGCSDAQ